MVGGVDVTTGKGVELVVVPLSGIGPADVAFTNADGLNEALANGMADGVELGIAPD